MRARPPKLESRSKSVGAETRAEEKIGGDNERYIIYQVLFLARSSVRFHGCNV